MNSIKLRDLVAEFKQQYADEITALSSNHFLDTALNEARDFLMHSLRGADKYWYAIAEAIKEEFEPGSKAAPCIDAMGRLDVETAFADSCGSKVAPAMIVIRKNLEAWHNDTYPKLERFSVAQAGILDQAIDELRKGRKITHWMWFVFPQLKGLGQSEISQRYGLHDRQEVEDYISNPFLFPDLVKCTHLVLKHTHSKLEEIFPFPDNLKFISCMTVFALCQNAESVFDEALAAFNSGNYCIRTIELLAVDT